VLIADGGRHRDPWGEEERRLLYVGMTRARETLTLGRILGEATPWLREIDGDWLVWVAPEIAAPPPEVLTRRYRLLTLADLDLGYAGRLPATHPVHDRLSALRTGDRLQVRAGDGRILLHGAGGLAVARLSERASAAWLPRLATIESTRVVALFRRLREDGDPAYRDRCRSDVWEVPVVEFRTQG
jgi:ATP-dependent DNA helicase RecQ